MRRAFWRLLGVKRHAGSRGRAIGESRATLATVSGSGMERGEQGQGRGGGEGRRRGREEGRRGGGGNTSGDGFMKVCSSAYAHTHCTRVMTGVHRPLHRLSSPPSCSLKVQSDAAGWSGGRRQRGATHCYDAQSIVRVQPHAPVLASPCHLRPLPPCVVRLILHAVPAGHLSRHCSPHGQEH